MAPTSYFIIRCRHANTINSKDLTKKQLCRDLHTCVNKYKLHIYTYVCIDVRKYEIAYLNM